VLLLFVSCSAFLAPTAGAIISPGNKVQTLPDGKGIRIVVEGNFELYFNATNGGEITEYFDLMIDPSRSRNLANIGWKPYYNLLPLFSSIFYNPYSWKVLSTGGDPNAMMRLIANTSEYVILQASSRIMSRLGEVARDTHGNTIYVNSTWIIRNSGLISVERTFFVPSYAIVPSGWRWYPFYLTRRAGFGYNGIFGMFNTTYAYASIVNEVTYRDVFTLFSPLPKDAMRVFGVALPFSNSSIGGDGAHSILIAYKYDELVNADEWRSDNYYSEGNQITESGAVHEFSKAVNVSTHTYHMMLNLTRQPISQQSVQDFAKYYANNPEEAYLLKVGVTTDKPTYQYNDSYTVSASGVSYFNLTEVTAKLTVTDSIGNAIFGKNYGPGDLTQGQAFNTTLLRGTISPYIQKGYYTVKFQIFSSAGITIASDSKVVHVI